MYILIKGCRLCILLYVDKVTVYKIYSYKYFIFYDKGFFYNFKS